MIPFLARLTRESVSVKAVPDDAMKADKSRCHSGEKSYPEAVCEGNYLLQQMKHLPGFDYNICCAAEEAFKESGHPVKASGGQSKLLKFGTFAGAKLCWKAMGPEKQQLPRWSKQKDGTPFKDPENSFNREALVQYVQVRA